MPLPQKWYSNTANAKVSCVSHSGADTKAWGEKKPKKPTKQKKSPKTKTNDQKTPNHHNYQLPEK